LIKLAENRRITPEDYDRDIRHLQFDLLDTKMKYNIGDALAIYPQNDGKEIADFLEFFKLKGDDVVKITPLGKGVDARKVDAFKKPLTVTQLFVEVIDVLGRPTRRFYESMAQFASDPAEKEAIKKLLTTESKAEYQALAAETVTYVDLLRKYPSVHPSIEHLVQMIPTIKPRYYSIASAQRMFPNAVQLCIVIVDWKTPTGKYRIGTCTGYVSRVTMGSMVACAVKPSTFTLPPNDSTPVLMAGLGTGLAPFRAFVQDRAQLKRDGVQNVGPLVMYYGCRHRSKDFIYGDELEAYHKEGVLTHLRVAFSRDQVFKVYVQNKIEEDPELLYKLFNEENGYFYMCGNAGRTVTDIRNAVIGAWMKKGNMTQEEADKMYIDFMIKGRYNVEAW